MLPPLVPLFGLKTEGYCFDFAYRKFIIAEARRRIGQVNRETSILEIQNLSADSGKYLAEIEKTAVSVDLSHAVFGRADWAILLSCFACLWSGVVEEFVDTGAWTLSDLLEVLRSGKLTSHVASYKSAHGYAPHPYVLFENYTLREPDPPAPSQPPMRPIPSRQRSDYKRTARGMFAKSRPLKKQKSQSQKSARSN